MVTAELNQGLTFLAYTTGIIVFIVGAMLVKVLFDVSKLTQNLNETAVLVKNELEPTLKNINKSVSIISGMIIKTDENMQKVKAFISKTPLKFISQVSQFSGKAAKGFFGGLCTAFKYFSKK